MQLTNNGLVTWPQKGVKITLPRDLGLASSHTYVFVESLTLSSPTLAKNLHEEVKNVITQHKECWSMLFNLLTILGMLFKFLKVVMLCIMVLPRAHLTPRGIVMCRREMDFSAARTIAVKKSGISKQLKMRTICPHLYILFCVLKMSSDLGPVNTVSPSTSGESSSATSTTVTAEQEVSVSRRSTIKLNMRRVIPYPVP